MSTLPCLLALCLASASVPSPHTPITPASAGPAAPARHDAPRFSRRTDALVVSGGVLLAAASCSWGAMVAGLRSGAFTRSDHNRLVADVNAAQRPPTAYERDKLAAYDRQGAGDNKLAIAGAIVGTALTALGSTLLARGLVLGRRQGRLARLGLRPSLRLQP